jgi:hypothetical protein
VRQFIVREHSVGIANVVTKWLSFGLTTTIYPIIGQNRPRALDRIRIDGVDGGHNLSRLALDQKAAVNEPRRLVRISGNSRTLKIASRFNFSITSEFVLGFCRLFISDQALIKVTHAKNTPANSLPSLENSKPKPLQFRLIIPFLFSFREPASLPSFSS